MFKKFRVHFVFHPHRIASTFLKFDFSYYIRQGNKSEKKGNCKKKNKFYAYKKIYYIFENMGAIPCWCNFTSTEIQTF